MECTVNLLLDNNWDGHRDTIVEHLLNCPHHYLAGLINSYMELKKKTKPKKLHVRSKVEYHAVNKMQIRYLNYMYNKCRADHSVFLVWHIVVIIVVVVTARVRVSWNGPG